MKIRMLAYYDSFRCLCGACPDTCCAGWDVEVDRESRARYTRMDGAIGEKACRALKKEDGEWSFRLEGGRCPFLMDSGLCEMQAALGEAALPRTCRLFPRIPADFGGVREVSLSVSCPEAARLLLESGPLKIVTRETEEPPGLNEIDAGRYLRAMALKDRLVALAQRRELTVGARLALCVCLAADAAGAARRGEDPIEACLPYVDGGFLREKAAGLTGSPEAAAKAALRALDRMERMERLTDRWDGVLKDMRAACLEPARREVPAQECENLLVYYLFRYCSEAAFDGNLYLPAKFAVTSVAMIRLMWGACRADTTARRTDLVHLYSREIENSRDNLDSLFALLRRPDFGNRRTLTALAMG